jgi:hypothetical protein
MPISAAVFPTPAIARRLVRQSWDEWPVDAVFPMLYHTFYEEGLSWIGACVQEGSTAMESRAGNPNPPARLMAGLYLPSLDADERISAAGIARESGAHGVSLFELNGIDL